MSLFHWVGQLSLFFYKALTQIMYFNYIQLPTNQKVFKLIIVVKIKLKFLIISDN